MSRWGLRDEEILDYKSECYIASRLDPIEDEWGNQLTQYGEPKKFYFNIQPATNSSSATVFGQLVNKMKVAVIPKKEYLNEFNEFDLAYLDGCEPVDESFNGEQANYRIYSIQPQNAIIKVYFLKIIKGEEEVV